MKSLIEFLATALTELLPGEEAQAIMMPSISDRSRFSLAAREDARPGGIMILFYQKGGCWYFPLIQRPDYDGVHAKQISFPGGKKDTDDKNLITTALRETYEEIGIKTNHIEVLGSLTELYIIASNFNVLPVVGFINERPEFFADAYEVDEILEVKVDDLMQDANRKEKPLTILQGITIHAPYFDLNSKVVWGATAMILSELKTILLPYYKHK